MKTNWMEKYSTPGTIKKFQAGGAMADPNAGAGAPTAGGPGAGAPDQGGAQGGGGGDLQAMLQEYAQSRDPQLAVTICDTLVQMMAQQQGGAGAGAGGPQGGAPAGGPQGGAPAGKNGMKLSTRGPVFKK